MGSALDSCRHTLTACPRPNGLVMALARKARSASPWLIAQTWSNRRAPSIAPTPEDGSERPGGDGVAGGGGKFVEVAQEGDDQREGEEQRHQRAQPGDGEPAPPALGLESHHDGEPANDDDPGCDRARAGQVEPKSVAREQVPGDDSDADREPGGDREAGDRLQETVRPPWPELGARASTKAGMPIVTVEAIVNWRGSSG